MTWCLMTEAVCGIVGGVFRSPWSPRAEVRRGLGDEVGCLKLASQGIVARSYTDAVKSTEKQVEKKEPKSRLSQVNFKFRIPNP